MSEEHEPYKLIETGERNINRGRITEKELAYIGAEAEDEERSKRFKHIARFAAERLVGNTHSTLEDIKAVSGDTAGEKAMANEVARRVYVDWQKNNGGRFSNSGLSNDIASEAAANFTEIQKINESAEKVVRSLK